MKLSNTSIKNTMVNKNVKHIFSIVVFTSLFFLNGCKKSYEPLAYKQWIESDESGLNKSKSIGDIEYKVQFLSPEYKLLINKGPIEIKEINIENELLNYKKDYSFSFTVTNLNGIPPLRYQLYNEDEYFGRIEYMNSEVINDFYLLADKKDTIKCLFAHMERDFGISPELRLQVSFGEIIEGKNIQFCYNDKMLNNGLIKFTIFWDNLQNLPELKKG